MRIIHTVQAMRHERAQWTGRIGFVPTMGYLHAGHLSLLQHGRITNDVLVASIFVNPTQFGAHEDLATYPQNLDRDLLLLEQLGVDYVFVPTIQEMYPQGFTTYVVPEGAIVEQAEGAIRPGHFRGVATVVLKLFQIVQPQHAYFGQKDAQQVVVVTRMVEDLNLAVAIHTVPTIREKDGLAMSSRNSYLDEATREAARILYEALQVGRAIFDSQPQAGVQAVITAMRQVLNQEQLAQVEYVEIRDPATFLPLSTLQAPALLLVAAQVGPTRLIDNFLLRADGTWDTGQISNHQHIYSRYNHDAGNNLL